MLVLNTTTEIKGLLKTNSMLDGGGYPNLQNAIIILPKKGFSANEGYIQSKPAVLTVAGTKINEWCCTVAEDLFLKGGGENKYIKILAPDDQYNIKKGSLRIGVMGSFLGGEVVGKYIYTEFSSFNFHNVNSYKPFLKLDFIVKLLHSDGTLTTIGNLKFQKGYESNGQPMQEIMQNSFSGSGVVARAGDILVLDIEYEGKGSYKNDQYGYFSFGNLSIPNGTTPIQISID